MPFNHVQAERLDFLLKEFKEDSVQYRDLEVGDDYQEKRMALRSLMNIRSPKPVREDVVKIQDEFLAEETKEKGFQTEFFKGNASEFDRVIFNVFKDMDRELYEKELVG